MMKLTKKDKEILKSMGYVDWANYTSYRIAGTDKTFSEEKALEFLERKAFLSGLARSTFSGTSYRKELNGTRTIMIESRDFFLSKEKKGIYECFKEAVEFLEQYDNDESDATTLYFHVSPRFLAFISSDYENITGAEISLEYPKRDERAAQNTGIGISPTDEHGCIDWCDFNLPYEQINMLFEIADEAQKKRDKDKNSIKLIDGITECCGFDFGMDYNAANYCPICGKRIIQN